MNGACVVVRPIAGPPVLVAPIVTVSLRIKGRANRSVLQVSIRPRVVESHRTASQPVNAPPPQLWGRSALLRSLVCRRGMVFILPILQILSKRLLCSGDKAEMLTFVLAFVLQAEAPKEPDRT